MIPEAYWALIRRWGWLILLFSVAGAAAALYLIPIGLQETSSYDSSTTLVVTRFLTSSGTVLGDGAMAEYTQSVALMAKTPQFAARLNDAIAEEGVLAQELNPARNVKVNANKELSRITVQASAGSPQQAQLLVQKATDFIIEQMAAEEQRIIDSLRESITRQRDEVLTRLRSLQEQRTELTQSPDQTALLEALDDLVQRSSAGTTANEADEFLVILADLAEFAANPELALVSAEIGALEAKLGQLSIVQQDLAISLPGASEPAFVLSSPDTVPTGPVRDLRKRDMLVLGGLAGAVMGWVSANGAEYLRNGRRNGDELGEEGDDRGPA